MTRLVRLVPYFTVTTSQQNTTLFWRCERRKLEETLLLQFLKLYNSFFCVHITTTKKTREREMYKVKRRLSSRRERRKQHHHHHHADDAASSDELGSASDASSSILPHSILRSEGDNSLRTNGSSSDAKESCKHTTTNTTKRVSFHSVHVREYERALGDNPSCSSGAPVT